MESPILTVLLFTVVVVPLTVKSPLRIRAAAFTVPVKVGLAIGADRYIYTTANDVYTTGAITTFGRSLVDDADASTARTTLGLGTISTQASGNYALKSSQYIMGILFS